MHSWVKPEGWKELNQGFGFSRNLRRCAKYPLAAVGRYTHNPIDADWNEFFSSVFGYPERMSHSQMLSRTHSVAHSLNTHLSILIEGSSNLQPSITWTTGNTWGFYLWVWGKESVPICIGTHCILTQGQVLAYNPLSNDSVRKRPAR